MTDESAKKPRGFATMSKADVARFGARGGKAAHAKGVAHEFTSEEASAAGRIGGKVTQERKREMKNVNRKGVRSE
jgi:uncharacterized protein